MTDFDTTDALHRFSRKSIPWLIIVRQKPFLLVSLSAILLYCIYLPDPESVSSVFFYLNLSLFTVLLIAWCINILADSDRPEVYKMLVAFFMMFIFGSLFYRFAGADWTKLVHFFFNFSVMKGAWHVLFKGLGTTIFLAICSFLGCIALGLTVAVLRNLNISALNIFIKAYVDIFRSIPVIVLMVVLFFACPFLGIYLDSFLTTFISSHPQLWGIYGRNLQGRNRVGTRGAG